jgi:uncharacterized protein (DUF2236 family)
MAAAGRIAQPAGRAPAHDDSSACHLESAREAKRLGHLVGVGRDRAARADPHGRTHAERLVSRDGYFAPESVIRKVGNTPLTPFLGGGSAVLLQVAHPLVAAGIVQHSDYRRDLWRRLGRTLRALYFITYGTKAEAEWAAEAVQTVHAGVHGKTDEQLGRFPAGTPYSASDPALMLWVHATLVEASLSVYQRFVETLSPAEQERYYQEMGLVARLFGTPASALPLAARSLRLTTKPALIAASRLTPLPRELAA